MLFESWRRKEARSRTAARSPGFILDESDDAQLILASVDLRVRHPASTAVERTELVRIR